MKRLILLRHAKAVPAGSGPDRDRDLAPRGLRDAAWAGATIAQNGWAPDAALVSDAMRTRRTMERALPALSPPPSVLIEPRLYAAAVDEILGCIAGAPAAASCLLVVGHNPGIAQTALRLAQAGSGALRTRLARGFPTATLAVFQIDTAAWSDVGTAASRLDALLSPP